MKKKQRSREGYFGYAAYRECDEYLPLPSIRATNLGVKQWINETYLPIARRKFEIIPVSVTVTKTSVTITKARSPK